MFIHLQYSLLYLFTYLFVHEFTHWFICVYLCTTNWKRVDLQSSSLPCWGSTPKTPLRIPCFPLHFFPVESSKTSQHPPPQSNRTSWAAPMEVWQVEREFPLHLQYVLMVIPKDQEFFFAKECHFQIQTSVHPRLLQFLCPTKETAKVQDPTTLAATFIKLHPSICQWHSCQTCSP